MPVRNILKVPLYHNAKFPKCGKIEFLFLELKIIKYTSLNMDVAIYGS